MHAWHEMGIWNSIPSCRALSKAAGSFAVKPLHATVQASQAAPTRPEVSFAKCASLWSTLVLLHCPLHSQSRLRPGAAPADKPRQDRPQERRVGRPSGCSRSPRQLVPYLYYLRSWTHLGALACWLLPLLAAGQIDRSPSGSRAYFR
jgi:hypothetical protein